MAQFDGEDSDSVLSLCFTSLFSAEQSSGQSWAELADEELVDEERHPGRVVEMHEKLSSPSRIR